MSHTVYEDGWPQPYKLMDAQPYWDALQKEELSFQRCKACAQAVWPAHWRCPHCSAGELEWQRSAGRGSVYSFSTVMRGPTPKWGSIVPYTVGFVELDEGYFLFTQIDEPPETIAVGRRVEVRFTQRGSQKLPVFVFAP